MRRVDVTEDDMRKVRRILSQCHTIDPRFPAPNDMMATGWFLVFHGRGYTWDELEDGVLEFFATDTFGRTPTPGLVLEGAKWARKRRAEESGPEVEFRRAMRRWEQDCAIAEAEGDRHPRKPQREDYL